MTLLATFLDIVADWRPVFPQQRTFRRAVRQALGSLVCLGRRCLSRILWTWGGQNRSWSGEYFLHSRCQWQPQELFAPFCAALWTTAPAVWWEWPSMTPACPSPAAAFHRLSTSGTPCPLPSM